jgi:hypothetical protein
MQNVKIQKKKNKEIQKLDRFEIGLIMEHQQK